MNDVAAACGITKSTVSRTLGHPHKVSPATRDKVERAMTELGYVYNPLASSLSGSRRKLVGVLYSLRLSSVCGGILALIDTMAAAAGYEVMFAMTNGLPQREKEAFLRMKQYKASAFICLEANAEIEDMLLRTQAEGYPCLMLHQTPLRPELNFVGVELRRTTNVAAGELLGLGHRRVGLLLGYRAGRHIAETRHAGYKDALEGADIPYDPRLVRFIGALTPTSWQPVIATGRAAVSQMLSMDDPPTAIVVPNSSFAVGVLAALRDAGLSVPRDFSIMVLQEDDIAACLNPSMCTLDLSKDQEYALLGAFLQQVFQGEPVGSWRHILPIGVHRRNSCGPCRS